MTLEERIRNLEQCLNKRIILRGQHSAEPLWRGRITERPSYFLLEYRDDTAGFFWDVDIICELLQLLEEGFTEIELYEEA